MNSINIKFFYKNLNLKYYEKYISFFDDEEWLRNRLSINFQKNEKNWEGTYEQIKTNDTY